MITQLKTVPQSDPLTLDEAKVHLRINLSITDQDDYIDGLIAVATEAAESFTQRRLLTQTWIGYLDAWPGGSFFELPFGCLQSVTSVIYKDRDGVPTIWDSSKYIVDLTSSPGRVVLAYGESWPSETLYPSNPISIEFVCGYANATAVPSRIKHAIKVFITDLFNNPESLVVGKGASVANLKAFERLLWPYKIWMKE